MRDQIRWREHGKDRGAIGVLVGRRRASQLEQPDAGCIIPDSSVSNWIAYYVPKTPKDAARSCNKLTVEELGVFKFSNPVAHTAQVVIRPMSLASLARHVEVPSTELQSTGKLDLNVKNDIRTATKFSPATVDTTKSDAAREGRIPAEKIAYQFLDAKFYSKPGAPGTQMKASLKYSHNGCEVNYDVYAVWPATACDPEAFAKPTPENAAERCGEGSGLNPDFDLICVADSKDDEDGFCVPGKKFPALKP